MKHSLTILSMVLIAMGCKKEPKITTTYELTEEMMAYFVNYDVGTKWIYQDTMDLSNYDTIELVSKQIYDVNNGNGSLSKGFTLYYKPSKSKDFRVNIGAGKNHSAYVNIDPMVTAAGAVIFENYDGKWSPRVNYFDSLEITGNTYFEVIESETTNMYHYMIKVSKYKGIVFFYSMQGGAMWASYKLIKTIKP